MVHINKSVPDDKHSNTRRIKEEYNYGKIKYDLETKQKMITA